MNFGALFGIAYAVGLIVFGLIALLGWYVVSALEFGVVGVAIYWWLWMTYLVVVLPIRVSDAIAHIVGSHDEIE